MHWDMSRTRYAYPDIAALWGGGRVSSSSTKYEFEYSRAVQVGRKVALQFALMSQADVFFSQTRIVALELLQSLEWSLRSLTITTRRLSHSLLVPSLWQKSRNLPFSARPGEQTLPRLYYLSPLEAAPRSKVPRPHMNSSDTHTHRICGGSRKMLACTDVARVLAIAL
jgi:hypothetical protein